MHTPVLRALSWLLVVGLLTACGIESVGPVVQTTARPAPSQRPGQTATTTGSYGSVATEADPGLYLIDRLVRSTQLDGIDLHLRYAERTADALILHVSFYNNRGEDLAYVSGASVNNAELVGDQTYTVSATSPSLASGIDPDGGWLNGGATVGTITFAGAQGDEFEWTFPGFPTIDFALDQPIEERPDPPAPEDGSWSYAFEATSPRLENIALRVDEARIEGDALLLTIAFVNRNSADITFTSTVSGGDAVVFDGMWQQYRPGQVDQSLDTGIEPAGDVWGEGEANSGTLTFPRPTAGDVLLLHFPSYPLIRIPLQDGAQAGLADPSDLPPSVVERPTPTALPTPTPLTGNDLARQQADELFASLNAALQADDRDAYLAAFTPDLQASQADLWDRISSLPIEQITFEPLSDDTGTLNADESELGGLEVDLQYLVRDVDPDNVFSSTGEYTLRREGDRWLIAEVGGQQPFWAIAPTEARRAGPFWIFYRPEMEADLPAIEEEAQQAFEQVNAALPNRARPVNVMHITATEDEFAQLTERSGTRFLGVAAARFRIRKAGIQITSQAFFINGAAFESDPQQDRQRTIAHELTHLVLSPQTMPFTPAWISEGAAQYVTDDYQRDLLAPWYADGGAAQLSLEDLTAKTSFGEYDPTGEQTSIDYAYSAYLARYIAETYGEDMFLRLYDSYADVPFETISADLPRFGGGSIFNASMGSLAQKLTPDLVQDTLGVDLQTLERDFETWLAEQLG